MGDHDFSDRTYEPKRPRNESPTFTMRTNRSNYLNSPTIADLLR